MTWMAKADALVDFFGIELDEAVEMLIDMGETGHDGEED